MFWPIFVTMNRPIQNVLLWLESRHGVVCATINAIDNNALFHPNSHINQMPPQIIHILRFFCYRLAVPDFVPEVKAVR